MIIGRYGYKSSFGANKLMKNIYFSNVACHSVINFFVQIFSLIDKIKVEKLSKSWRPRFGIWFVNWLTCIFVTRMEVPRLKVNETRELERRRAARQVEPRGMEELWSEGSVFINTRFSFQTSLHLVDVRDTWREA